MIKCDRISVIPHAAELSRKVLKNIQGNTSGKVCFGLLIDEELQDTYYVSPAASERLKKKNTEVFQNIPSGFYVCAKAGVAYEISVDNYESVDRIVHIIVDGQFAASFQMNAGSYLDCKGFRGNESDGSCTYSKFQFSDDSTEQDAPKDNPDAGTIQVSVYETKALKRASPQLSKAAKQVKLSATSKSSFHTQITTKPGQEIVSNISWSHFAAGELLYTLKCYYKPLFWLQHAGIIIKEGTGQNNNYNNNNNNTNTRQSAIVIDDEEDNSDLPPLEDPFSPRSISVFYWGSTKDHKVTLKMDITKFRSTADLMKGVIEQLKAKLQQLRLAATVDINNTKMRFKDNEGDFSKILPQTNLEIILDNAVELLVENKFQ